MDIHPDFKLSRLTAFHIGGAAKYYAKAASIAEFLEALDFAKAQDLPVLVLGGASNMLVSDNGFAGVVIQVDIKGLSIAKSGGSVVTLKCGAGENWDDVVKFAVDNGLWGIENLSAIPGRTGGLPVQNVGAYGVESEQVIEEVEILDLTTREVKVIQNQECGFTYRQSNFNTIWKNQFVVLYVYLKLSKQPSPVLDYVDVKKYFENKGVTSPSLQEIREAIIDIRSKKFPPIEEMGSNGSFFKNLLLDADTAGVLGENIRKNFSPEVVAKYNEVKNKFPARDGLVKIPSAFLIDICGLKGAAVGGARLWEKQPLVIVNTGTATAADVATLFKQVRQTVYSKTGMVLMPEPEFVGFDEEELREYFNLN